MVATLLGVSGAVAITPSQTLFSYPHLRIAGSGDRGEIRVRITAPADGRNLPILLFSHGATYSGDDYRKIAIYFAAHGFVVIQPTHLDARILATAPDDPRQMGLWRSRRDDLVAVLDQLPALEAQVPGLADRVDAKRVVVAGHSYGGFTAELLLGATTRDPSTGLREDLSDPRVLGGILLSAPGGADGLTPEWTRKGAFLDVDWSTMRKPTLVVIGETDLSAMTAKSADWHADAYNRAPSGRVCLLELAGVGHFLGGVGHAGPPAANDPDDAGAITLVEEASLAWAQRLVDPSDKPWRAELGRLSGAAGVRRSECR